MNAGQFKILESVKTAYLFIGREWAWLTAAGAVPLALQVSVAVYLNQYQSAASPLEGALWSLPATIATAWYACVQTRLMLLGERFNRLPPHPAYRLERQRCITAAVSLSVLFNLGLSFALSLFMTLAASEQRHGFSLVNAFLTLLLLGFSFWAVRLALLPVAAAVGYPLRRLMQKTWGMLFSLRLLGLGLVALLPLQILLSLLLRAFNLDYIIDAPDGAEMPLTLILVMAPFSLATIAILNAAVVASLRQILGEEKTI